MGQAASSYCYYFGDMAIPYCDKALEGYGYMKSRVVYILIGLSVFSFIFQTMLRYSYVKQNFGVTRIDRLTGNSCELPCLPQTIKEHNFDKDDEEAIEAVKRSYGNPADLPPPNVFDENATPNPWNEAVGKIAPFQNGHKYLWRIWLRVSTDGHIYSPDNMPSDTSANDFPIRLVCYCYINDHNNKNAIGTFWEYNRNATGPVPVSDNAMLRKKYNIAERSEFHH
jgi:hypothetical protein